MNTLRGRMALFLFVSALAAGCGSSGGGAQTTDTPPTVPATPTADAEAYYALDWKLAPGEVLAYDTAMDFLAYDMAPPLSLEELRNTDTTDISEQEFAEQLVAAMLAINAATPKITGLVTLLNATEQGTIAVRMIADEVSAPPGQPDIAEYMPAAAEFADQVIGTLQTRAELSPDGAVLSPDSGGQETTLLTLFFQLPAEPVRVGDVWAIDVTWAEIDADDDFVVEDAWRVNEVTFSDVARTDDGRPVAVLDYVIIESVDGHGTYDPVLDSMLTEDDMPVSALYSFVGQGRFLIDEGRWDSFAGQLTIHSTGVMTMDVTQMLALTPTVDYPAEYVGLE